MKGLLCPVPHGYGKDWACVGPVQPDPTNISYWSGLLVMQLLYLFKNPCKQPFDLLLCGKRSGNSGQKRSWNPCSATALVAKFSLKVVILYKLAWYLISSALKSSLRFLYSSGERRKEVSGLLSLEYLMSPARLNLNKMWGCEVVLDSIHFLNSWARPSLSLSSHVWKSFLFPCSLFFYWLQISCCQFLELPLAIKPVLWISVCVTPARVQSPNTGQMWMKQLLKVSRGSWGGEASCVLCTWSDTDQESTWRWSKWQQKEEKSDLTMKTLDDFVSKALIKAIKNMQ